MTTNIAKLTILVLLCVGALTQNAHAQQQAPIAALQDTTARERAAQLNTDFAQRFELAQSQRTHWLRGAIAGFVIGAGVTALILYSGDSNSLCNSSRNQDAMSTGECLAITAGGGAVGAGIGALIGSRIKRD